MTKPDRPDLAEQRTLRLGVIGMSEGNGHPFSWSAILNGYDRDAMASCPFPAIPKYLAERAYPQDFLADAAVTHVWTQDPVLSRHIAAASLIGAVVDRPEDMIGQVDGILLARDDAESHERFAKPFLLAGLPIYIDKPLSLSRAGAEALLDLAGTKNQLFSCSALRYARELELSPTQRDELGEIRFIDAWVPKYWDTYAIHVIEPVLAHFAEADEIAEYAARSREDVVELIVKWRSGLITRFTSTGSAGSPIGYRVSGTRDYRDMIFSDSFFAFRSALLNFIGMINGHVENIERDETLKIIDVLALGRRKAVDL